MNLNNISTTDLEDFISTTLSTYNHHELNKYLFSQMIHFMKTNDLIHQDDRLAEFAYTEYLYLALPEPKICYHLSTVDVYEFDSFNKIQVEQIIKFDDTTWLINQRKTIFNYNYIAEEVDK